MNARLEPFSTVPALGPEQRMARRIVTWTIIAIPFTAAFFALLVLFALRDANVPLLAPMAAGAVVGVSAGAFAGLWVGTIVSGKDFDDSRH